MARPAPEASQEAAAAPHPETTLEPPSMLKDRRIVLIVTGGIAVYKACTLVRGLVKAGAGVRVVMTEHAAQFVAPLTFETLSGHPVALTEWPRGPESPMPHIDLNRDADLLVVCPATANILAKAAHGVADDLASTLIAARRAPIVFVPAMNVHMWRSDAARRSVETLKRSGALFIGPDEGFQACGDVGAGRMTEPEAVLDRLSGFFAPKTLEGRRVLVTAGPTYEALDPVRGVTNRSSGRQGYAVARAARDAGAQVTLVSGPTMLRAPEGVRLVSVESAREMLRAVEETLAEAPCDLFFSTAAVADWRPENASELKMKKCEGAASPFGGIRWAENPDILKTVSSRPNRPYAVGFAAETAEGDDLLELARAKRARKGCDLIVANDARRALERSENAVRILGEGVDRSFGPADKDACARFIVEAAALELKKKENR